MSLLSTFSCSHTGVAVTPAAITQSSPFGAVPDTHRIAPLYSYGGRDGVISGIGGNGGLIGTAAGLFGTAPSGGDEKCMWIHGTGCGVVYKLTPIPGSSRYKETRLHVFKGAEGAAPIGRLYMDKKGELYGTTYAGGTNNAGVIYKINVSGSIPHYSIVHNFGGAGDGAYPFAGVIEANDVLYGTTVGGGKYSSSYCHSVGSAPDSHCGTIYSLDLASGAERVIHNFGHGEDGLTPAAPLLYENGTLYGTTPYGGKYSIGIVFAVTNGKERILSADEAGGTYPFGGLIAINGTLYGTTDFGGMQNGGTVYALDISSRHVRVLYSFARSSQFPQGAEPAAAVIYRQGKLWGTAPLGGATCHSTNLGCGMIFSLAPDGTGFTKVAFRGGLGGYSPTCPLLYSEDALYGTTTYGGKRDEGIAFKLAL
ncbi:MAG: hypothetical protein JO113_07975 [Candidatus Eremiobacteraeota bacterium]|nr:hypothetical protein [Candidatus Eremiobacteraeota bacterium]